MGTHPIFESDFDCLTWAKARRLKWDVATRNEFHLTVRLSVQRVVKPALKKPENKFNTVHPTCRTALWAAAELLQLVLVPDVSLVIMPEPSPPASLVRTLNKWQMLLAQNSFTKEQTKRKN